MKIFVCRQSLFFLVLLFIFTGFPGRSALCHSQPVVPENPGRLPYLIINKISIDGNKITRSSIIYRELSFREHDTIPHDMFPGLLKTSRENIFNTALFNIVTIDSIHSDGTTPPFIDIRIHVIERWYIWPWPYFVISDR